MITVLRVGRPNSDDKLSQEQWSGFVQQVRITLAQRARETHGEWYSLPDQPYQNACFCMVFADAGRPRRAGGADEAARGMGPGFRRVGRSARDAVHLALRSRRTLSMTSAPARGTSSSACTYTCVVEIRACRSIRCTVFRSAPPASAYDAHAVPQVMQTGRPGDPGAVPDLLPLPVHVPRLDRRPQARGEHQAEVGPRGARPAAGAAARCATGPSASTAAAGERDRLA